MFKKLKPYGLEIIFVDTGSTDTTKSIASKYTDKIYDFKWCDDFSKAKNFAISKISNDYVLIVDSDEFITGMDIKKITTIIGSNKDKVGRIQRINKYTRKGIDYEYTERVNRLFSKKLFEYRGRIHEQVTSIDTSEYKTFNIPIFMDHVGYSGDEKFIKQKTERNIKLLLEELEINGKDPYILYQLGKSYYMQESTDFVFLMGMIYMNNGIFDKAICELTKATAYKEAKTKGVNSYMAYYNMGVIYECLGQFNKAKDNYRKCGNYNLALERLKNIR